jgi:predicted Fe-S protein YdhL (DUF1289 family)
METPCILICSLDAASGYCVGCGRTGEEIGDWTRYSDDERHDIMTRLPARMVVANLPLPRQAKSRH